MKTILITLCILVFAFSVSASVLDVPVGKIIDTDWLGQQALKYGILSSFAATQLLTGMTEGYHFNGKTGYVVREENYHTYETMRRIGWMTTGWFTYANIRDADLTWIGKGRRILGSLCISRNFFEWGYKYQRYQNPFDYTEAHNEHALVYIKISNGKLTDAYIGTGPVSGPLVDIGFLVLGMLLFK